MSGHPDDSYYNDSPDPDRPADPRADAAAVAAARRVTMAPAIGLIALGLLTLIMSVWGLIQMPTIGQRFDEMIREIDADPNVPAPDKQTRVDLVTKIRDFFVNYGVALYASSLVAGLVITAGGARFLVLGSAPLVIIASIVSMVPINACCPLGVVFGIWSIVALTTQTVKAGYEARRRSRYSPDAY